MTDKHEELAGQCEAAEGPDRELDCEIMDALNLWLEGWTRYTGGAPLGDGPVYYLHPTGRPEWQVAEKFTASIDVALTLVPEGWDARITCLADGTGEAMLNNDETVVDLCAANPALAICAAALRAKGQTRC